MKQAIWFIGIVLLGCSHEIAPKKMTSKTYTVEKQIVHNSLHFTGSIKPLHENTLSSPMGALVESMNYHYGQFIKKGEVVMVLNSVELQKQYNDTLTEYLKAKDSFVIAKAKFVGTTDLWDAGLISKNNYLSEKSSLDMARMALLQSSQKLKEMAEKIDDPNAKKVNLLSLAEFDKINQALEIKHNLIHVRATTDGVLLESPRAGDAKNGRITVGSRVKAGEVLGLIGDLSGLSVEIEIPEVDIHKIHLGMPASIEGVAFGGQNLAGEVVAINAQASSTQGGGLPSFNALVEVKKLTPEQQRWIKVGMSASITLTADNQNAIFVPIAALRQEKGQSIVQLQKPDGSFSPHSITTGSAQADKVLVTSGLQAGDVVLYG